MKYLIIVLVLGVPAVLHAAENVRPQGYRHVDLRQAYDRTYGGYWWVDPNGDICEEGITIQGNPLVCSLDTMLVLDAGSAEVRDLHFVDGDIRRTWTYGGRATAVHVFTKQCPDSLVGSWGTYEPVFFRFRPGVLVEDIRRPGYTETLDTTHQVGALTYKAVRPRPSPLEVKQTWFVAGKWCVTGTIELRNLTGTAEDAAAIAVGLNLRSPVNLNRPKLDWYADFHSNGKAGVAMVPRLSDAEYQKLTDITMFHVEYRPRERCFVARTGCDVRAPQPAEYFACLMLDAPVSLHVLADGGDVHKASLFAAGKGQPQKLETRSAAIGLRSASFRLGAGEARSARYAIALGKTADEAVADARRGLGVSVAEAVRQADAAWAGRLPAVTTGDAGLDAHLRYAAITQDVNWEPDGRAPGDLGGWGRQERAEVCGYKNYYDQDDMVVPILDMPVYDPDLYKRALLLDIDPQTQRLRKCGIWRQQYDNMLFWPRGAYKVWLATGDDEFLKRIYPALDKILRWLRETRTEPDGLLRMLTMPYDMFTIGVGDDRPVTVRAQAVACDAFQAMARMAEHLKRDEDSAFYGRWRDQVRQATREKLWHKSFYSMSLDFPEHFSVSGNCSAILAGLCDGPQANSICREIARLYTGTGFPELHPPVPGWVGTKPYGYQNGDMYVDQLALIARAANKTQDRRLLGLTLFEFRRILQRWKCFPVTIHPWNADTCGGVNEIHSASALVAILVYGVAGVEEGDELRFRPVMIPEVGGRVEIRDLLYRGTRFHVLIEGRGARIQSVQLDGQPLPEAVITAVRCDGRSHTVTLRMREE
jgi:hypothetical protein